MATDVTFVHLLNRAYYLETLPVKFDLALLALVAAGSVTLAVVASAVPAFQASRQRPIEVLRRV
jgi:lipoprotein-releasing system permease protein